jgi:hypothetical protein
MTETLQQCWAREDAFVGPQLPSAAGGCYNEERLDRCVFTCSGHWWIVQHGSGIVQGPFNSILHARIKLLVI